MKKIFNNIIVFAILFSIALVFLISLYTFVIEPNPYNVSKTYKIFGITVKEHIVENDNGRYIYSGGIKSGIILVSLIISTIIFIINILFMKLISKNKSK